MLRYVSIGIISIRIISIIVEGVVELSIFIASANWYFYLYEDNILQLLQQPQLILHLYVQKNSPPLQLQGKLLRLKVKYGNRDWGKTKKKTKSGYSQDPNQSDLCLFDKLSLKELTFIVGI